MSAPVRKNLNLATREELAELLGVNKADVLFVGSGGCRKHVLRLTKSQRVSFALRVKSADIYYPRYMYRESTKPLRYWVVPAIPATDKRALIEAVKTSVATLSGIGADSIRKLQERFYIGCTVHDDCLESESLAVACLEQRVEKRARGKRLARKP